MRSNSLIMLFQSTELIAKLYAAHHEGNKNAGFDIKVSPFLISIIAQLVEHRPSEPKVPLLLLVSPGGRDGLGDANSRSL